MLYPTRLSLSSDGRVLCCVREQGALVVTTSGRGGCEIALPDVRQALAFAEQVWLLAGAEGLRLHRFGVDGRPLGPPLKLPGNGEFARLRPALFGPPAAILDGPQPVELGERNGELWFTALAKRPGLLIPRAPGTWIRVEPDQLCLRNSNQQLYLPLPGELRGQPVHDGQLLADNLLALVVGEAELALILFELRQGQSLCRLSLGRAQAVRLLPGAGQVLVQRSDSRIELRELPSGQRLGSWLAVKKLSELAADREGARLVLLTDEQGSKPQVESLSIASLLAAPDPEGASSPRPGPLSADATLRRLDQLSAVAALSPRPQVASLSEEALMESLESALELVAAWCKRAIAHAWDSGRLSALTKTGLPHAPEVAAVLDAQRGQASAELEQARARERTVVQHYEARWRAPLRAATEQMRPQLLSPLELIARECGLSELATDILLIVAAPLLWGELSRMYGIIANDPARPLCDELLVGQILGSGRASRREIAHELSAGQPLRRLGMISAEPGGTLRPFAALNVSAVIVERLWGHGGDPSGHIGHLAPQLAERSLADLHLPDSALRQLLLAVAEPPRTGHLRLVLRGRPGSGRRSLLAALAAAARRTLGVLDASLLLRERPLSVERLRTALSEAWLRGYLPCITGLELLSTPLGQEDQGQLEQVREVLRSHPGPLTFRATPGSVLPLDAGFIAIELPALNEEGRVRSFWRTLEEYQLPVHGAEALAARYRLEPGTIRRVCEQVAHAPAPAQAALEAQDGGQVLERIERTIRQHRASRIGSVATRVERLPSWSSLVLPPENLDSLREFISRLRHRRTVMERWGFDRLITSARGLTALFQGGSGTGKTMAAGVIARELDYELYRIDLGRIMSKWIGETERNLAAAFDAAEEGEMVLLFDEADSLFAKRTEVSSSVDRYANIEVNYLLQRLDTFEGVAILTTNFGTAIDAAFKRRLSMRMLFPFPDEELRQQLWRSHIPPELPIAGPLDFQALAEKYELSGGYIRNAALRAAYLAAEDGQPLSHDHLERAVRLEYREVGKLIESGVLE